MTLLEYMDWHPVWSFVYAGMLFLFLFGCLLVAEAAWINWLNKRNKP